MLSTLERILCIVVLLLTALVGYLCCVYIIIYAIFYSTQRTCFYKICVFKCVINFVVLSVFLFWIGPLIILADPSSSEGVWGIVNRVCFCLYAGIYELLLWVALILAVNRLVAILFSNLYERLFNTKLIYTVLLLISAYKTYSSYGTFFVPFVYRGDLMTWQSLGPPNNGIVYDVFILIGLACCFNFTTLFYVIYVTVICNSSAGASKRVRENSILFIQAFIQDLAFAIDISFMFILVHFWDNAVFQFFCANYTSVLVHAIDGPIMLVFQRHMLKPIYKLLGIKKPQKIASSWATSRSSVHPSRHQ